MKYRSVDETDQFDFRDCRILDFQKRDRQLYFVLEALIVRGGNSQNTHFTDSYAGETQLQLTNAEILSGIKEGYRYYNADGVLEKEVADAPMQIEELANILQMSPGAYLFRFEKIGTEADDRQVHALSLEFEDPEDYGAVSDSYMITFSFENAIFEWEEYKNKVQT